MLLDTNDISPRILKCFYFEGFSLPQTTKMESRYVYDYEIEFFTESAGGIMVNGKYHPMRNGDVHVRRPGQYVQGVLPYNCYFISIDLTGNLNKSIDDYSAETPQAFAPNFSNPILDELPLSFSADKPEIYENLFKTLLYEVIHLTTAEQLKIKALLLQLLYQMYSDLTKNRMLNIKNTPYYGIIKKSLLYIDSNFTRRLRIPEIAASVGLSPNYFQKAFVDTMGFTPNSYIIGKRMERARELLALSTTPIAQIAELCGFDNVAYFNYSFKHATNETPREYRNKYKY